MSGKSGRAFAAGGFNPSSGRTGASAFALSTSRLASVFAPPDFTTISDANVVVSLKNLLKKDSTTKTKALEDLLVYAKDHPHNKGGAEEGVLDTWAQLYPRVSIENDRRVRELSHRVHYALMDSARKRMEKRLPSFVGAWLAGGFDRDRIVAKNASVGLSSFMDTEDKLRQFWRKCQSFILEFATEAINETPNTLSDIRSTTPEDANTKYYRVIGASLSLVVRLIETADPAKLPEGLGDFLARDKVWDMAAADDSFVRRTAYKLLQVCLSTFPGLVQPHLSKIGKAFTSKALKSDQSSSAMDLIRALTELTKRCPQIWDPKKDKQPLDRLKPLVEKGSQGSAHTFWPELDKLLEILPQQDVSRDTAANFLKAVRSGISNRMEPDRNSILSWTCYITTFKRFMKALPPSVEFLEESFYPLTRRCLFPENVRLSWSCRELALFPKAWDIVANNPDEAIRKSADSEWCNLAIEVITRMNNSLPEVSKEFQKSQEATADEGQRWFKLAREMLTYMQQEDNESKSKELGHFENIVIASSNKILNAALDLLQRRNYKPFGAASVIYSALVECPMLFRDTDNSIVASLLPGELGPVLKSPSVSQLLSCVNAIANIPEQEAHYRAMWTLLVDAELSNPEVSLSTITALLSSPLSIPLAREHSGLQDYLAVACLDCAKGTNDFWALFGTTLSQDILVEKKFKALITSIVQLVTKGDNPSAALMAVEALAKKRLDEVANDFQLKLDLITGLLMVSELAGHESSIATRAQALTRLIDGRAERGQTVASYIIRGHLEHATPTSLAVDTLVKQAIEAAADDTPSVDLYPNHRVWTEALEPFLQVAPDPSLSLTSSIGGAYFLVKEKKDGILSDHPRDRLGQSIPARMALYTVELIEENALGLEFSSLPLDFQANLMHMLYLTMEIASDQLALLEHKGLWMLSDQTKRSLVNFVNMSHGVLARQLNDAPGWRDGTMGRDCLVGEVLDMISNSICDFSPLSLYGAKALSHMFSTLLDKHGFPSDIDVRLTNLNITKTTPATAFLALAFLTGFRVEDSTSKLVKSPTMHTLCRRLVSEIAGAFPSLPSTLHKMVVLNACISIYKVGEVPVDSRSMIMAVQQITSWTDTPDETNAFLSAEVCKGIRRLFPNVKRVYGPYWEQAVRYCLQLWLSTVATAAVRASGDDSNSSDTGRGMDSSSLPYIHASLKLLTELEKMVAENKRLPVEEQNDDLIEAVDERRKQIDEALIALLKAPISLDTEPSRLVDEILCRRVLKIDVSGISDLPSLFPVVTSESRDIQTAAFDLLDRALSAKQEEYAVDVMASKKKAEFPAELLSLLLDAPTLDQYSDEEFANYPVAVRAYLLAWLLIMHIFEHAPYKIREDYAEAIKDENIVSPLLDFAFDVMGHSAGHAANLDGMGLDASRIRSYEVRTDADEQDEYAMFHLLAHLFYLVLKFLPGLFRDWHRTCKSKQTRTAVESWMVKYFSPLVISDALDAVVAWEEGQGQTTAGGDAGDTVALQVRVHRAAREVTAGYEVDEEVGGIVIRLPEAFPLQGVVVDGTSRVAVNERRWRAWLMSTQGAITFSNGDLIDGLVAFRRNVNGALQGQSECAICYSIVSSDKKLPDKACPTCKNSFHKLCLYQWFQTSNANSCPLCRNPIGFLGSDSRRARTAA